MALSKAVVKALIGGTVEVRNVFSAQITLNGGESMEDVWNAYLSPLYDEVRSILANDWASYSYEILEPSTEGWTPVDEVSFVRVGVGTTEVLPNAVAAVILGIAPGNRHIGKKFFSAVGTSMTLGNSLISTALAFLADALLVYVGPFTTFSSSTFAPGVIDKYGSFHPFVGGVVSTLLGSQRRRKPGVGI